MGSHPSNPSKDVHTKCTLLEIIEENPGLISPEVYDRFGCKLPFLFKVLSIEKALSIQAHPNKFLAEILHKKDCKNYPDNNHKPEMTIAITPFEGLCGFRPLTEILHFLSTVPSLQKLIGLLQVEKFRTSVKNIETSDRPEDILANKKALRNLFESLMKADVNDIKKYGDELIKDARESGVDFAGGGVFSSTGQEVANLVIRLHEQFPYDIGVFVSFFLNHVKLDVGEAMFLKEDDIHAYLSGDIIECMAASDNVVRAGLTPKFKDIDTLVEMLTYSYAPIEQQKMKPLDYPYVIFNSVAYSSGSSAMLYDPPIEEFSVVRVQLQKKGAKATFDQIPGPSILICTSGNGTINVKSKVEEVKAGYVFFVGAFSDVILESSDYNYTIYKAFCELHRS